MLTQSDFPPLNTLTTDTNIQHRTEPVEIHYSQLPLSHHVEQSIRQYLANLDNQEPSNIYELMLQQLEKPLLMVVLEYTQGNQSKTAQILGINRGTLRKKLKTYNLLGK